MLPSLIVNLVMTWNVECIFCSYKFNLQTVMCHPFAKQAEFIALLNITSNS